MKIGINDINRGVVLFLGFGVDKYPHEHRDKLVEEFGRDRALFVEREVTALINEANRIFIDWTEHSLASAGEAVIERMGKGHPELSDSALRAIAWKFTFDWR